MDRGSGGLWPPNEKSPMRCCIGLCVFSASVLLREEHGCQGTVPLGDDVELHPVGRVVDGDQAPALAARAVIGLPVVGLQVPPIAPGVAPEGPEDVLLGEGA